MRTDTKGRFADHDTKLLMRVKAGRLFLSVIADRKIGKSAAPSGAGGEGPQKQFCTGCMFQK